MAGKWGGELLDLGSQIAARREVAGSRRQDRRAEGRHQVATKVVRRYPIVTVATVAGAGLLWYLARRKAKQAENGDGRARDRRQRASRGAAAASGTKRATRSTTAARPRAHAARGDRRNLIVGLDGDRRAVRSRTPPRRRRDPRTRGRRRALTMICRASDRPSPLDRPSSRPLKRMKGLNRSLRFLAGTPLPRSSTRSCQ
jgi:hypothetical protein